MHTLQFIILSQNDNCVVVLKLVNVWLICVAENPEFRGLSSFLMGESMGGAVCLKVHLKQPNAWNGAILVAPMCKVQFPQIRSVFRRSLTMSIHLTCYLV